MFLLGSSKLSLLILLTELVRAKSQTLTYSIRDKKRKGFIKFNHFGKRNKKMQ